MMWYNKSRDKGLNLDNISYWEYHPHTYLNIPQQLNVWFDSFQQNFSGVEAEEIYKMLCSDKELLNG